MCVKTEIFRNKDSTTHDKGNTLYRWWGWGWGGLDDLLLTKDSTVRRRRP